jgi:hypothetical protein
MKKFVILLVVVAGLAFVAEPTARAGVHFAFGLPIPVPVFYGPGYYGGYYGPGPYYGPYGYGYGYGYGPYWRRGYYGGYYGRGYYGRGYYGRGYARGYGRGYGRSAPGGDDRIAEERSATSRVPVETPGLG